VIAGGRRENPAHPAADTLLMSLGHSQALKENLAPSSTIYPSVQEGYEAL